MEFIVRCITKRKVCVPLLVGLLSPLPTVAGTLGTESSDYGNPGPTLTASSAGTHTISGALGPTPGDGQDGFKVTIPSSQVLKSIAYSGVTLDGYGSPLQFSLNGCGISYATSFPHSGLSASSCTLSFLTSTGFQTSSGAWQVTVTTEDVPNVAPALGGSYTTAGAVDDGSTISPFAGVAVSDSDGDNVSISITYTGANGTLSGTGLTGSAGSYTLSSADTSTLTTNLQALVFTPTANQTSVGGTVATSFTLTPNDGTVDGTANSTSQVTATSVNDAPANTGAPTVSGTINIGDTLSSTPGTWSDVDSGGSLSYSYQWYRADDNSGTGEVLIAGATSASYILTSADASKYLKIVVTADDSNGSTDETASSVYTAINSNPPVISSSGGNATGAIDAAEYQTAITTVTATDPDGDTLSYTITGGADQAFFSIDSASGELTFSNAPNFENRQDSGADNTYEVEVTVTDDGAGNTTDSQIITVTVTDANGPPVISSNGAGDTGAIDAAENQTAVTTVTATDPDSADTKTFSISGGVDQNQFDIDSSTGALTFKTAPDAENATDSGADNVYDVTVAATDNGTGTLSDTQDIAITVTSINEAPSFANLGETLDYTEDGATLALDSDVDIIDEDMDASNFDGATIQLERDGGASAFDLFTAGGSLSELTQGTNFNLGASDLGTVTTNASGVLLLTFNANATGADVDTVLQNIHYSTSNDTPEASVQINWTFNDNNSGAQGSGSAMTATGSTPITITATNDVPTLFNPGAVLQVPDASSYIEIPDHAELRLDETQTVSMWIMPTAVLPTWQPIMMKSDTGGSTPTRNFSMWVITNSLRIHPSIYSEGSNRTADTTDALPINEWSQVAYTYDGSVMRVYFNGVEVESASHSATSVYNDASHSFYIGGLPNGAINNFGAFQGQIADVRVYDTTLSVTEIKGTMRTKLVGDEDGLVFNTRFSKDENDQIVDRTATNNIGTLKGNAFVGPRATTPEGEAFSFTVAGFIDDYLYNDAEGNAFAGIKLSEAPTNGTLILNGAAVTVGQTVLAADIPNMSYEATDPAWNGTETFKWQAYDGEGYSLPETFSLEITSSNDAPVIVSDSDVIVEEDETVVMTVAVTDDDVGDTHTFSITGGADSTKFSIDVNTGELVFNTGQKSDAPTDTDGDNVYHVEVRATDTAGSGYSKTFAVTVFDPNDFDADGIPNAYEDANGMNKNDPSDRDTDLDGDGVSNFNEYTADSIANIDDYPPTITMPADLIGSLSVDATGLFTRVNLPTNAVAVDGLDGDVVTTSNAKTHYAPGSHTITWRATDAAGNSATATQMLHVFPLVEFSKDQTSAEGATVKLKVLLNGPSPVYPVTVPYTVSGSAESGTDHDLESGSVTINDSDVAIELSIETVEDSVAEGTETIVLTLGAPTNAAVGPHNDHKIELVEGNVVPEVSLDASQGGNAARLVAQDSGLVTFTTTVTDPNADDVHSFDWNGSDNAVVDTDGDLTDSNFSFDPASLSSGLYRFSVVVSDGQASAEDSLKIQVIANAPSLASGDSDGDGIDDIAEGFGDADGDGVPDYLDSIEVSNVLQEETADSSQFLIEAEPGVHLILGDLARRANNNRARVEEDDIESYGNDGDVAEMDPDYGFPGGMYDFRIENLPVVGQSVQIVVPQQSEIPEDPFYRKLMNGVWTEFVEDDKNSLASGTGEEGYCFPPGDASYTEGLIVGDWCVQLTIEDGGPNDADGEANGRVVDPGGVAHILESPVTVTKSGGGALGALIGILPLFRRRYIKLAVSLFAVPGIVHGVEPQQGTSAEGLPPFIEKSLVEKEVEAPLLSEKAEVVEKVDPAKTDMPAPLSEGAKKADSGPIAEERELKPESGLSSARYWGLHRLYAWGDLGVAYDAPSESEVSKSLEKKGHSPSITNYDSDNLVWQLGLGIQVHKHAAIELGYVQFGEIDFEGNTSRPEQYAVDVVEELHSSAEGPLLAATGFWPVNEKLDVTAQLGVWSWSSENTIGVREVVTKVEDDGTDVMFGIGGQWLVSPDIHARLNWRRYELDQDERDIISAGVVYHFGQR